MPCIRDEGFSDDRDHDGPSRSRCRKLGKGSWETETGTPGEVCHHGGAHVFTPPSSHTPLCHFAVPPTREWGALPQLSSLGRAGGGGRHWPWHVGGLAPLNFWGHQENSPRLNTWSRADSLSDRTMAGPAELRDGRPPRGCAPATVHPEVGAVRHVLSLQGPQLTDPLRGEGRGWPSRQREGAAWAKVKREGPGGLVAGWPHRHHTGVTLPAGPVASGPESSEHQTSPGAAAHSLCCHVPEQPLTHEPRSQGLPEGADF